MVVGPGWLCGAGVRADGGCGNQAGGAEMQCLFQIRLGIGDGILDPSW